MDAIETLMAEHRLIEQVLDALAGFVDEVERRRSTEKEELARFVAFIREFADAHHHGKEEDLLFAAMVAHGFPREGGPIAVMLREHDQGRALVKVLRGHAEAAAAWTDADRTEIGNVARGFATMLRAHIHKEDAILYPMAEQHLPPEALQEVSDACDRHDEDPARAGRAERLRALAGALVRAHAAAVHPADLSTFRPGCCG